MDDQKSFPGAPLELLRFDVGSVTEPERGVTTKTVRTRSSTDVGTSFGESREVRKLSTVSLFSYSLLDWWNSLTSTTVIGRVEG